MGRRAEAFLDLLTDAVEPEPVGHQPKLGGEPLKMSPSEFGKFVAAETEKRGKGSKAAGISVR